MVSKFRADADVVCDKAPARAAELRDTISGMLRTAYSKLYIYIYIYIYKKEKVAIWFILP